VHSASWPMPFNSPNIITVSRFDVDIRPSSFPIPGILLQDASARTKVLNDCLPYSNQSGPRLRKNGKLIVLKLKV
jgi:hypothetical protein